MTRKQLTPALMVGSFLLGLSFALAHHFHYLYLDEIIVQSQSQQQWHLRAGTGLAFLVRAFLSAAIGIAYTQILWRTLRSKSITIGGVNSLFGVIHNPWDFISWELWTAAPLLAMVAIIAWALPLVAIITPATLTVTVSSQPNMTFLKAPMSIPDYTKVDIFGSWINDLLVPSTYVSRLLVSVASAGSILTIPPPFPNSSYVLQFYGPTLSCHSITNKTFLSQVGEAIEKSDSMYSKMRTVFVGFVPNTGPSTGTQYGVNGYALAGLKLSLNTSKVAATVSLDYTNTGTGEAAKFYVAVPDELNQNSDVYKSMKTIECQLYNSSFATKFSYNNSQQDIINMSKKLNPVAVYYNDQPGGIDYSYKVAADAYLSLMDAMGQLLLGSLKGYMDSTSTIPFQTSIKSSVLMDTKEMHGLEKGRPESMIGRMSMSEALEDLFRNFTISLFSNSRFLQNSSAASLVSSASASYGSSFSTILRTTRNPDIDKIVPTAETTGAEPLSKHLSNVRLVLRRQEGGPESGDEGKATFFTVDSKSHEMNTDQTQDSAESLLQQDTPMVHTSTSVESSIVYDEALWERNGDLSLRIFNYRQDTRGD
ncbi:hypothetical protein NXS19_004683 [Fusarium pseudograminearum]|nr:hypothetical protein NXS19_004683 [Fusarium pseudograminearum]